MPDEEGDVRVEAMAPYSKDDTWAIYLYMCGSNLESLGRDSTSDLIKVLTANENAYLVLSYDCDTEETSIIGVQTMDEIAGADSMLRKVDMLMPGDKIKPLYYVYYEESDSIVIEEGKEISYNAGRVIQEETLKDGKYVEFLRVIDPRGDKYYTERVAFEIKNGKVKNVTIAE